MICHTVEWQIIRKLFTLVCGNHDAAEINSVFCSSVLNVERAFHLLAISGNNTLSRSWYLMINTIHQMTLTHFATQYLMQSNIFEFWVVISNICMTSSLNAPAVLSKRTWHPLSDLCMSTIKENEPSYDRQDYIYLPNVHNFLEDTFSFSTFPIQCCLSASSLHTS